MRVFHAHPACFHPPDAPGVVPQEEDVPRQALDGEVLVELPDHHSLGLGHHLILGRVGDGTAARHGRQARAAAAGDRPGHPVAVQARAHQPAGPARHPLGVHFDHRVEVFARQLPIGPGPARERIQRVLGDLLAGGNGDHLLGQHVQRMLRDPCLLQPPRADAAH